MISNKIIYYISVIFVFLFAVKPSMSSAATIPFHQLDLNDKNMSHVLLINNTQYVVALGLNATNTLHPKSAKNEWNELYVAPYNKNAISIFLGHGWSQRRYGLRFKVMEDETTILFEKEFDWKQIVQLDIKVISITQNFGQNNFDYETITTRNNNSANKILEKGNIEIVSKNIDGEIMRREKVCDGEELFKKAVKMDNEKKFNKALNVYAKAITAGITDWAESYSYFRMGVSAYMLKLPNISRDFLYNFLFLSDKLADTKEYKKFNFNNLICQSQIMLDDIGDKK